jgi:hypothetical protein
MNQMFVCSRINRLMTEVLPVLEATLRQQQELNYIDENEAMCML